jgi:hypothetical protein
MSANVVFAGRPSGEPGTEEGKAPSYLVGICRATVQALSRT